MKKFEYFTYSLDKKIEGFDSFFDLNRATEKINELGREGWELVSVVIQTFGMGDAKALIYTFKREL